MRAHIFRKFNKDDLQEIIEEIGDDDQIEEQCSITFDDNEHEDDFFDDSEDEDFVPDVYTNEFDDIQQRLKAIEKYRKEQHFFYFRKKLKRAKKALEELQKSDDQEKECIYESSEFADDLEALVNYKYRPAVIIKRGHRIEGNKKKWGETEEGKSWKDIIATDIEKALWNAKRVGRIDKKQKNGFPGFGTGFLVAKNTVLTNRHVVFHKNIYYRGQDNIGVLNEEHTSPIYNMDALYLQNTPQDITQVTQVPYISPDVDFDFAVMELEAEKASPIPLYPNEIAEEDLKNRLIYVLGHPYLDTSRNPSSEFDFVMRGIVGVKRLMPGIIMSMGTRDGLKIINHDCSTTGVTSGSPIIDLTPGESYGQAIGIHFGGAWSDRNYAVPSWEILKVLESKRLL